MLFHCAISIECLAHSIIVINNESVSAETGRISDRSSATCVTNGIFIGKYWTSNIIEHNFFQSLLAPCKFMEIPWNSWYYLISLSNWLYIGLHYSVTRPPKLLNVENIAAMPIRTTIKCSSRWRSLVDDPIIAGMRMRWGRKGFCVMNNCDYRLNTVSCRTTAGAAHGRGNERQEPGILYYCIVHSFIDSKAPFDMCRYEKLVYAATV